MPPESIRARAFKPPVLVPLCIGAAIAGAALLLLIGYAPFGHRAIERQIDSEGSSLCEKFRVPIRNDATQRVQGGSGRSTWQT